MSQKVQVWIYFDPPGGKRWVLLLKTVEKRGSQWQPVTGHVEPGESLEDAALREAQEETGLYFQSKPQRIGKPFTFEKNGKKFQETSFVLKFTAAKVPAVQLDPSEHVESCWKEISTALKMIDYANQKDMLQKLELWQPSKMQI